MKAMILAAGLGTRLGGITAAQPKCLVDVGGRPILAYVVDALTRAGATELVINLHYCGDQIRKWVKSHVELPTSFSEEPELLGTGGGIKQARKYLDGQDPFIVHNGDVYSEFNLTALLKAHNSNAALATLAVMQRQTSRPLLFDASSKALVGWSTPKAGEHKISAVKNPLPLAFSGIQVLSPDIFTWMENQTAPFSSIETYMEAATKGEVVLAHDYSGYYWIDMGTPEKLEELRARLRAGFGDSST